MSRFLNWFLTDTGKKCSVVVAGAAITLVYSGNILPHTFGINKYKELVQLHEGNVPKLLDKELLERAYSVVRETSIEDKYKDPSIINFFYTSMFEMFHAGGTSLLNGGIIGIPINFRYNSVKDVDTKTLNFSYISMFDMFRAGETSLLNGGNIGISYNFSHNSIKEGDTNNLVLMNWENSQGQAFKESLFLSEDAQKAAIAREVYAIYSNQTEYQTVIATTSTLFAYAASRAFNMHFNLYQRSRGLRFALYAFFSLTAFVMYFTLADAVNIVYEESCDTQVSEMGKSYLLGSIEFYNKLLIRNKIFRELLGDEGKLRYTAQGDKNMWLRKRNLAYTERLQFFKEQLGKLETSNTH